MLFLSANSIWEQRMMHRMLGQTQLAEKTATSRIYQKKLVPWGTDGRLPLSDLDLDLGSGHTAYRRALFIDLYLHTKFH